MRQAEEDLAAGRACEARTLLEPTVANETYNPALYELFGRVLLDLAELELAGLWLFLSSARKPEYEQAIGVFLGKRGRKGGRKLYESFPPPARLGPPDNYPEPLRNELKALDVPGDVQPSRAARVEDGWLNAVGATACGGCILFVLFCTFVGAVTVGRWILDRVFG
ncbi:MAG: hypothetical protein K2X82_05635 [Gemmataceae bacterium]|nr:hypothetical protein [Gemmataceae bacterium]